MDELDPVDDNEFVYRRIPPVYFDAVLGMRVQREAFRPTEQDTTGLSVLRARFAKPLDTLANLSEDKAKKYYVARISVADIRKLGLTVTSDPITGGPPGHAVIPELSWERYEGAKDRIKPILVELAKLASTDIVHGPSSNSP